MPADLKLPLLGDVMTEGKLAEWLQPDGAAVHKGDPLYQLETDKVNYTVEAPSEGRLQHLVPTGETVAVGTVVGRLVDSPLPLGEGQGEGSPSHHKPAAAAAPTLTPALSQREREQDDLRITPAARRLARQLGVDISLLPTNKRLREADVQAFHAAANGRVAAVQATPAARRLARELGVDLGALPVGRLLREADVRSLEPSPTEVGEGRVRAAAGSERSPFGTLPLPNPLPGGEGRTRELSGRRRVIAERMHASLRDMAQLTISMEVDMTEALRLRQQLKQLWPDDQQPTITDLIVRAAVLALQQHPHVNATLEEMRLTQHQRIDVGLAVDVEAGLIVPVVTDAASLRLNELAQRTKALAAKTRDNTLTPDDVHGGTFTVTNLGHLGVDFFTPIVNPPQVAILGVGRTFPKLVLQEGEVRETTALHLSLSFDHRAIDGAPAARFLQEAKRFLELPVSLVA